MSCSLQQHSSPDITASHLPSLAPPTAALDGGLAFIERRRYPTRTHRLPQFYSFTSTSTYSPAFCEFGAFRTPFSILIAWGRGLAALPRLLEWGDLVSPQHGVFLKIIR